MLNKDEVNNLIKLLCNPIDTNFELGLELVLNNTANFDDFKIPIFLFLEHGFLSNHEKEIYFKQGFQVLWRENISKTDNDKYNSETLCLQKANKDDWGLWFEYKKLLKDFELYAHLYEPFILNNKHYLRLYKKIASNAKFNRDREVAYHYFSKIAASSVSEIGDRLQFVDFMLNECFPKGHLLEELDRVEEILNEGINTYPQFKPSYLHILATIEDLYRKNKTKAKSLYRESLSLKPDSAGTLNNLANILFKLDNEKEEARRMATLAVKIEPRSIHYNDTLAWIEFKGFNNLQGALFLFERIRQIDKNQEHHASLTGIGEVLEALGRYDEAEYYYKKGLKLRPNKVYKLQKLANLLKEKLNRKEEASIMYDKILEIEAQNNNNPKK